MTIAHRRRLTRHIAQWRERLLDTEADVTLREGQIHDALAQWHDARRARDRTAAHLAHLIAMAETREAA